MSPAATTTGRSSHGSDDCADRSGFRRAVERLRFDTADII